MANNMVRMTGEINNVDFTREDGISVIMFIPPDTPAGTRTIITPRGLTLTEHRIIREAIRGTLANHGEEL